MKLNNYQNLFNKVDKVFPNMKWDYFFIPFFIIVIIYFSFITLQSNKLNKEFYNIKLKATITNIERKEDGFYYYINSDWYHIKHPIVNYISIGDSILKEAQSLHIQVKNNNEVKWDSEVKKSIVFEKETTN
jgi:hypothetical protein